MNKLLQMFLDGSGDTSSKRVMAVTLVINGIIGAWFHMPSENIGILIGSGLLILGVQAVTKT